MNILFNDPQRVGCQHQIRLILIEAQIEKLFGRICKGIMGVILQKKTRVGS